MKLGVIVLLGALAAGAGAHGETGGAEAAPPPVAVTCPSGGGSLLFHGLAYRRVAFGGPLRRGAAAGDGFWSSCLLFGRVDEPCVTQDCAPSLRPPPRNPVARVRGVRPSVALIDRDFPNLVYVRVGVCVRARGLRALVGCLARASKRAAPLPVTPPAGVADLRVRLALDLAGPRRALVVATVENIGPAVARDVALTLDPPPSAPLVYDWSCRRLASFCLLGDLRPGEVVTVTLDYDPGVVPRGRAGALATAATADPDAGSNTAYAPG